MGTWMTHIQIAENLYKIPGLDAEQFVIGNIAPDAGLPDENWVIFEPPKTVTHFEISGDVKYRHFDIDFYQQFLQALSWPNGDHKLFSFMLGYFSHLVVNNRWILKIWRPTKEKFLSQFESITALGKEVKRDWYGLDFIYVRDHSDELFWNIFLGSECTHNYLDHFPQAAIPNQMAYIKEFYQPQDDKIIELYERPYIYLSQSEIDTFIDETSQALINIYELIWEQKVCVAGNQSALELLEH